MLKFSPALQNIPDYPFSRVNKFSKTAEQRDGINVINARIGIPDIKTPQSIKQCLSKFVVEQNSTYGYPCDVHY
jgi:aspartate/methionine/tyrosine aminotransferase